MFIYLHLIDIIVMYLFFILDTLQSLDTGGGHCLTILVLYYWYSY